MPYREGNILSDPYALITIFFIVCILGFVIYKLIKFVRSNPFTFPFYRISFDISGRRNVDYEDLIDEYLLSLENIDIFREHEKKGGEMES